MGKLKKISHFTISNWIERQSLPRAVFFNQGSAEPRGSAKMFLGSAKFLTISPFIIIEQTKLQKFEKRVR
jgi:hypothetical protein